MVISQQHDTVHRALMTTLYTGLLSSRIPVLCREVVKVLVRKASQSFMSVVLATAASIQGGRQAFLPSSLAIPILSTPGDQFPHLGAGQGYLVTHRLLGNSLQLFPGEY